MMLIQFRLKQHEAQREKDILKQILEFFKNPLYRESLDSRDPLRISNAIEDIVNKITNQPEFKQDDNYNLNTSIRKLANELKEDILLLSFTLEYLQKQEDDVRPSIDNDNDSYSDFISQFRAYLDADRLTDVSQISPGLQEVKTAFEDMQNARTLGINEVTLGDLVFERLGPINPSQAMQTQTVDSMPPGLVTGPKGFSGTGGTKKPPGTSRSNMKKLR